MMHRRNEMEVWSNYEGTQAVLASGSVFEAPERITKPGRENPPSIRRVLTACFLLRYEIGNYLIPAPASHNPTHLSG